MGYQRWRLLDTVTLGPWRRRRRLDRLLVDDLLGPAPVPRPTRVDRVRADPGRRPRRDVGERRRTALAVLVTAGLLAVVAPMAWQRYADAPAGAGRSGGTALDGRPEGWPSPPRDESDDRLLPLPTAPEPSGPSRFLRRTADGSPVAYDPCRPIHYVVNTDGAPAGATALVRGAVARVSAATGLRFVDDGRTRERVTSDRPPVQQKRYGDRWAPVLISWDSAESVRDLAGDVAGEAGSLAVGLDKGTLHYVTGVVTLDRSAFSDVADRPRLASAIVLHELGHLVGLDHVDDATQLMFSESRGDVLDYGSGDLAGLARLGAGACYPHD